jgi:biopolymer transport protein ExbD
MPLTTSVKFRGNAPSFNITALIDIVFLLIIFFLVVCQFIESENFPVAVPDGCSFAASEPGGGSGITTITVMQTEGPQSGFAVGPEKVSAASCAEMIDRLAGLIDIRLQDLPAERRVVTLRVDRDVRFAQAQYALAAAAQSSATNIRLAAFRDEQPDSH